MEFLNALFTAAFDNNIVFAQLIAMVSVILVAQRPQDAIRMGGLLGISVAVAGVICWPLYAGFLLPWGVSYLAPLGCVLASTGAIFVGGTSWVRASPPRSVPAFCAPAPFWPATRPFWPCRFPRAPWRIP